MRFHELDIQEGIVDSIKGSFNKIFNGKEDTIKRLSIPSGKRGPEVADIQKVLKAAGYGQLLGPYGDGGVDGIRGKFTSNAIATFQKEHNIKSTGIPDQETIAALNLLLTKYPNLPKSTSKDVVSGQPIEVGDLSGINVSDAKKVAESYLGRPITTNEWNWLIRATAAEASNNPLEQANVMGVILNRARAGNNIISVLRAPNQFQAVTGTSHNPGPSNTFSSPSQNQIQSVLSGVVKHLASVPTKYVNFTAANPAAYGPGTTTAWLKRGQQTGTQIGQTYFFS